MTAEADRIPQYMALFAKPGNVYTEMLDDDHANALIQCIRDGRILRQLTSCIPSADLASTLNSVIHEAKYYTTLDNIMSTFWHVDDIALCPGERWILKLPTIYSSVYASCLESSLSSTVRGTAIRAELMQQIDRSNTMFYELAHASSNETGITPYCVPIFIILFHKSHFSLLSSIDGAFWHHHDSLPNSPHESYAPLWLRTVYGDDPERRIVQIASMQHIISDAQTHLSIMHMPWIQSDGVSCLLYVIATIDFFMSSRVASYPYLPPAVSSNMVNAYITRLRFICTSWEKSVQIYNTQPHTGTNKFL